jgi:alpha-L-fucosidase
MWDTQTTDFKVTRNGGTDILKRLADACHTRGIKLGLYYSVVDWKHPAYPNEGRHHELPLQPNDTPDEAVYLAYLKEQVRELCSNYGDVSYIWWDMNVPTWEDESIHSMIRELQPACVINDRGFHKRDALNPWRDGIIITRERDYQAALSESGQAALVVPTESCDALDQLSWGYKTDADYYSLRYLKQSIADNLALGGNYLLNVGPDANGNIPLEQLALLKELGDWYGRIRECFDGTQLVSGLVENPNVLLMQRDNTYYVIAYKQLNSRGLQLRPIDARPNSVQLLNTGAYMQWARDIVPNDVTRPYLRLRELPVDALAGDVMVLKMEFDKPLAVQTQTAKIEKI